MRVGELCLRDVATIGPDERVVEAAKRMQELEVTELVVVQSLDGRPRPLGLLSEHDLVASMGAPDLDKLRVGDVLRDGFVAVTTDEPVDEALHRMRSFSIRTLPVIDRTGTLYGLVTLDQLLASVRAEIEQPHRESRP